jgi:hypothetical protein
MGGGDHSVLHKGLIHVHKPSQGAESDGASAQDP